MSKDDLSDDFVNDLMQETGFNRSQIHKLYIRFQHLDKDKKGYLVREDLINVPQVAINPVGEKIVEAFLPRTHLDPNGRPVKSTRITFSQFVRTFAVFRPIHKNEAKDSKLANSKENKTRFLFNLIDASRNGTLSRSEIIEVLEMMVGAQVSHDQLVMIAERLIQEADKNSKGTVDFEEFMEAVTEVDIEGKMAFITFY